MDRITRTRIKICGITRAQDVAALAGNGADALGLVFYEKSPRHVTVQQAMQLAHIAPPFLTIVGLFVNPTVDCVREVPLSLRDNFPFTHYKRRSSDN